MARKIVNLLTFSRCVRVYSIDNAVKNMMISYYDTKIHAQL